MRKMSVLLLEDRGAVSGPLTDVLVEKGFDVVSAFGVSDAQTAWSQRNDKPIDCLIVDLNMSPHGLSEEEYRKTRSGLLTGWVWLANYVFIDEPKMKSRTIVFSDYLEDFIRVVDAQDREGVLLVSKRFESVEKLLRRLREVEKSLEGKA
jgi:DNA-binding NarL/FixJ family response regulator